MTADFRWSLLPSNVVITNDHPCLLEFGEDGWLNGRCYQTHRDYWNVVLFPIPQSVRQHLNDSKSIHALLATEIVVEVHQDNPRFRLILSEDTTTA